jgi:hypothetical protein
MRAPLLSRAELQADPQLRAVAEKNGWLVYPHVKLSDVIDPRPDGVDDATWRYGTRAHFDFVVVDEDTRPVFAVEIDGLSHAAPETRRRDEMKDSLVEAAEFELLRVGTDNLDAGPRGRFLLEYLIDARQFMEAAWDSGLAEQFPDFDPDYRSIVDRGDDGSLSFVNHLSEPARRKALKLHQAGAIPEFIIHGLTFAWRSGWSEAWCWIKVGEGLFLHEKAQVRDYGRFMCGIAPFELAQDLAASAVGNRLEEFLAGAAVAVRPEQMQRELEAVQAHRDRLSDSYLIDHCRFA